MKELIKKKKRCLKCNKVKLIGKFPRKTKSEGHRNVCESCINKRPDENHNLFLAERAELKKRGKRRCTKCREIKSLEEDFYTRNGKGFDGKSVKCRVCSILEKRQAHWLEYNINGEVFTQYHLEKMHKEQGGKCKICKLEIDIDIETRNNTKAWAVDHCHETMKVRGLLCNRCNKGLGQFKDNIGFFKSAIKYLEES